eukprot:403339799
MEKNQTLHEDELNDLDILEKNINDNGLNFLDENFFKHKQRFVKIFGLQKQKGKDIELSELISKISYLMDFERVTFAKLNNRMMELKMGIVSYFSGNQKRQRFSHYISTRENMNTIRIIKLSRDYLDKTHQLFKSEPSQKYSGHKSLPQKQAFLSSDSNMSELSQQDEVKPSPILQNIKVDDIIGSTISQENLKLPSSILLSCEESKSQLQIVEKFGTCIKRALWVFENDEVYKLIKFQQGNDPIFFTKQLNQDFQFGFRVQNYQVIDKKKVVYLKDVQVKFTHTDFVEIEGQGFQHLSIDINKQIENSYQKFLETNKDNSTSFYLKNDAYSRQTLIEIRSYPRAHYFTKSVTQNQMGNQITQH